ncbi:MAG: hypothetical protein ACTSVY_15480 [Candidatus Helarchaeota archaeon]
MCEHNLNKTYRKIAFCPICNTVFGSIYIKKENIKLNIPNYELKVLDLGRERRRMEECTLEIE